MAYFDVLNVEWDKRSLSLTSAAITTTAEDGDSMHRMLSLLIVSAIVLTPFRDISAKEAPGPSEGQLLMTEFDLGLVWFRNSALSEGFWIRTALDYQPWSERVFFRLNIDAMSARFSQAPGEARPGFDTPLSINDVVVGSGYRWDLGTLHALLCAQVGVAVYGLPVLQGEQVLTLTTVTKVAGAARVQAGVEYDIVPDAALTLKVLGQRYWGAAEWRGADGWAMGVLLGIVTEL